jgi:WD40 repeat protein
MSLSTPTPTFLSAVAWSPSSNAPHSLVSVSYEGKLNVWDIRSGSPLHSVGVGKDGLKLLDVVWVGEGTVACGGEDGQVHLVKI